VFYGFVLRLLMPSVILTASVNVVKNFGDKNKQIMSQQHTLALTIC